MISLIKVKTYLEKLRTGQNGSPDKCGELKGSK
jgi:hypothetical protein